MNDLIELAKQYLDIWSGEGDLNIPVFALGNLPKPVTIPEAVMKLAKVTKQQTK